MPLLTSKPPPTPVLPLQILIPPAVGGARVVIASDGVWDSYVGDSRTRVAKLVRKAGCGAAAVKITSTLVSTDAIRDDTSVVVLDLTPPSATFPEVRVGVQYLKTLQH